MNGVKKLLGNKGVVTIVAGIACLLILFFAYNYRVSKAINAIEVPYALRELSAREEIKEEDVGVVKVASSLVTSTVIRSKNNVIGKYVNYNTLIPAGSLFYSPEIVTWNSMPDSAWNNIYKDYTIFSLPVSTTSTYGNTIYPDDVIDLYYLASADGKLVFGKLIEGITVLAVKDSAGNHIFKKGAGQKNAAALIFAVPEDLHLLLRKALAQTGSSSIVPVVKNANYNPGSTRVSSEYLTNLILANTREVPLDFVDEDQNNGDDNNGDNNNDINITE